MQKVIKYTMIVSSILILVYSLFSFQLSMDKESLQYMVGIDPSFQITNYVLFLTVASDNLVDSSVTLINLMLIFAVINLIIVYYYYFKSPDNSFKLALLGIANVVLFSFITIFQWIFMLSLDFTDVDLIRITNSLLDIKIAVQEYNGITVYVFLFSVAFLVIILYILAMIVNKVEKTKKLKATKYNREY